ncbi:MotA/TolQ/ExbB proton channel family protein [Pseudomonas sp. NPDC007930]|uniref:MotA/TolQ/ExbB proton channel family protein n=1 Tax=Pseudomonas sp. NPDC007930 TaxID=3364417 RepID=UPI0036EAD27E
MNTNLMHDITFYVMYGALAIAVFIIIERSLYFAYVARQARRLVDGMAPGTRNAAELPQGAAAKPSLPLAMARAVLEQKASHGTRKDLDDVIESQYLESRAPLARSLWIIETIVTAAPLLGLLGTILGIIDTFKALASAGVSDPGQISAGIGTALYATGLGIAIALFCVVFHNLFQDRVERINDLLKRLLIRAAMGARTADELAPAHHERAPQLRTL